MKTIIFMLSTILSFFGILFFVELFEYALALKKENQELKKLLEDYDDTQENRD